MNLLMAVLGAVLVGLTLGLLGSGGSILTVPVLVYLLDQPEKVAIAGSLAIVGAIAAVGAVPWARAGQVHWRSVWWFGIPGMAGTVGGAWASVLVSGAAQLAVFALVMLAAGWFMLRPAKVNALPADDALPLRASWKIVVDGALVGALTGFVGVGGGFLIVPALVLLGRLTMHQAIGTSLVIIALKSFAGFIKYLSVLNASGLDVDWQVIGAFIVIGILGSVTGNRIATKVPQLALRKGFGTLLLVMAVYILWRSREVFL